MPYKNNFYENPPVYLSNKILQKSKFRYVILTTFTIMIYKTEIISQSVD